MTDTEDPRALAEAIIHANEYMILATADDTGSPWSSPVWFATADNREFFWVSSPAARHSRNLAVRPELAFSIFDSQQVPGTGRGVYVSALAAEVPEDAIDAGIAVFSDASRRAGIDEGVDACRRRGAGAAPAVPRRASASCSCSRPATSGSRCAV